MLLQMFRTILMNESELLDKKIDELVDVFMNITPAVLTSRRKHMEY